MSLYKGYVKTKNKKCVEPFKNRTDFKSLDEVQSLPEYAGILADDAILIDIDDPEQSEILMKIVEAYQLDCRVVCTSRGRHFLFKNETVRRCAQAKVTSLAIGLPADIKVGCRASYEVLKTDGHLRFVEWDIEPSAEYQIFPKWLTPIKSRADFTKLGDGDGRNQALFNYILTLTAAGFTKDETRECIRIINKFVLKSPLSDAELEVILRDEAFQKPVFYYNGAFLFDRFSTYLINSCNIRKIDGTLHIYRDGVYVPDQDAIEHAMIEQIPNLRKTNRREVLDYMKITAPSEMMSDANYIAFSNGVLDIRSGTLLPFSPEYVITNKIPHAYDPGAYSEDIDTALNQWSCGDTEIRSLLEECIGYCFYRKNILQKAFILVGRKSNGKSTFLECIQAVLGDENISALDLAELGEKFSTVLTVGKLANIGDDISDDFLHGSQVATFKKMTAGNAIKVERKGEPGFMCVPYAKLLFSANNMPRISDRTGAVLRRLVIIPFNAEFKSDADPRIIDRLTTEESLQYLVRLGVEGLIRILSETDYHIRGFTVSASVEDEIQRYREENDPLIGFLEEYPPEDLEHEKTNEVYTWYTVFCAKNKMQPMAQRSFSLELRKRFGLVSTPKTVNGKTCRVYEHE